MSLGLLKGCEYGMQQGASTLRRRAPVSMLHVQLAVRMYPFRHCPFLLV
jgi:hypothetical protein